MATLAVKSEFISTYHVKYNKKYHDLDIKLYFFLFIFASVKSCIHLTLSISLWQAVGTVIIKIWCCVLPVIRLTIHNRHAFEQQISFLFAHPHWEVGLLQGTNQRLRKLNCCYPLKPLSVLQEGRKVSAGVGSGCRINVGRVWPTVPQW